MTDTTNQPVPTSAGSMQPGKPINNFLRRLKRVFRWFVFILCLFIAVFIYWKYFFTYSEGYRAGLLQKFSRKGTIFKTYEGEIILSSVQSNKEIMLASEKFFFSVKNEKVVRQLDSIQGHFIVIHYEEKNGVLPWRGESRYLVDSVRVER